MKKHLKRLMLRQHSQTGGAAHLPYLRKSTPEKINGKAPEKINAAAAFPNRRVQPICRTSGKAHLKRFTEKHLKA
jgi:hypothetical protein